MSRPSALSGAWESEYARLARAFVSILPGRTTAVVEVGGGRGQLTLPLARLLPRARIVVIDRFAGPYAPHRDVLFTRLRSAGLRGRVRVLSGDATRALRRPPSGTWDAVVSSEFLSELTLPGLDAFFESCQRALKEGGVTVHAFLSPRPRNDGQKRTIEADSDPHWTTHPPPEWFSPSRSVVRASLKRAGFTRLRVEVPRSRLRFLGRAARVQLTNWGVRGTFYRSHEAVLQRHGLELPDWILVSGTRRPQGAPTLPRATSLQLGRGALRSTSAEAGSAPRTAVRSAGADDVSGGKPATR